MTVGLKRPISSSFLRLRRLRQLRKFHVHVIGGRDSGRGIGGGISDERGSVDCDNCDHFDPEPSPMVHGSAILRFLREGVTDRRPDGRTDGQTDASKKRHPCQRLGLHWQNAKENIENASVLTIYKYSQYMLWRRSPDFYTCSLALTIFVINDSQLQFTHELTISTSAPSIA